MRGILAIVTGKSGEGAKKVDGEFVVKSRSYIEPLFGVESFPLASNLPMVCVPVGWRALDEAVDQTDKKRRLVPGLGDLVGGYLNPGTSNMSLPFRLLTTKDSDHYYALFTTRDSYERLCDSLTQMQSIGFMINSDVLGFIEENMTGLVDAGLLKPPYRSRVNISQLRRSLQRFLKENKYDEYRFSTLWVLLEKRVQQARYERFVLELAKAYDGYQLYFPAFIDFRGRIYQSGILHFHERDIVKSLICFYPPKDAVISNYEDAYRTLLEATAYHHQTFNSRKEAVGWSKDTFSRLNALERKDWSVEVLALSSKSKNPFQFLSHFIYLDHTLFTVHTIPISMDASSSAYQIMSDFLLNKDLAKSTNLILGNGSDESKDLVRDLYSELLMEFQSCIYTYLDKDLADIVRDQLTRKLFKSVYMPLVYGKTKYSARTDILKALDFTLTKGDAYKLADAMYRFWAERFPARNMLMELVNEVGWLCGFLNKPVKYHGEHITTIQDYVKCESFTTSVYNTTLKKTHRSAP